MPAAPEGPLFNRILVAVDGRDGGRDALALAALLQRSGGGELTAAHVYRYDRIVSLDRAGAVEAVLQEDLLAELEGELAATGVAATRKVVVTDPAPVRALLAHAERDGSDLIVMGCTHRSGADRVLAGDVTAGTLHGAPCAVAVASPGFARTEAQLRTIGVGFDDGPEARAALALAAELARAAGARLALVTVVDAGWPVREAVAEASTELLTREVDALDGGADGEVVIGRPARELAARSAGFDLLVVGSRRYGPLRRLVLGSTSGALVRTAACPVLVLPRGARGAPHAGSTAATGAP